MFELFFTLFLKVLLYLLVSWLSFDWTIYLTVFLLLTSPNIQSHTHKYTQMFTYRRCMHPLALLSTHTDPIKQLYFKALITGWGLERNNNHWDMQEECQHVFSAGCVFLTGVSRGGENKSFSSSASISCLPLWRSDQARKTAWEGRRSTEVAAENEVYEVTMEAA